MKKLFKHSLLAFGLISAANSFAAVVYTDIPDETLQQGGTIEINMDNSGAIEFTLEDMGFGGAAEPGIFFNGNEMLATVGVNEWDVLAGYPINTTVDANSSWESFGDAYIDPFWGTTAFPSGNDTYMAARFEINSNMHYGWVRVNWDANGTLIVKDYAYESTAGAAILTGDQGGAQVILVTSISIQGQGGATSINNLGGTLQMEEAVLPMNATDNSVTWSVQNGTGSATISATGLLTAVSDGDVTVTASANDGSGITGVVQITITNQSTVGIAEFSNKETKIGPNPFVDQIQLVELKKPLNVVQIININGQILKQFETLFEGKILKLSDLNQGMYIIQFQYSDGETVSKRIIRK